MNAGDHSALVRSSYELSLCSSSQGLAGTSRYGYDQASQDHIRPRLLLAYAQVPIREGDASDQHGVLADKASGQRGQRQAESAQAAKGRLESPCHLGVSNAATGETFKKAGAIPFCLNETTTKPISYCVLRMSYVVRQRTKKGRMIASFATSPFFFLTTYLTHTYIVFYRSFTWPTVLSAGTVSIRPGPQLLPARLVCVFSCDLSFSARLAPPVSRSKPYRALRGA